MHWVKEGNPKPDTVVEKTEEQWQSLLTPEVFAITRKKGTERAFSSDVCHRFDPGVYQCVCCKTPLFDAQEKYDSGSGWPAFSQPLKENLVAYSGDYTYGMVRVEILCNTCQAHLGHVFPDGPPPSELRYCVNAISLEKIEK